MKDVRVGVYVLPSHIIEFGLGLIYSLLSSQQLSQPVLHLLIGTALSDQMKV